MELDYDYEEAMQEAMAFDDSSELQDKEDCGCSIGCFVCLGMSWREFY